MNATIFFLKTIKIFKYFSFLNRNFWWQFFQGRSISLDLLTVIWICIEFSIICHAVNDQRFCKKKVKSNWSCLLKEFLFDTKLLTFVGNSANNRVSFFKLLLWKILFIFRRSLSLNGKFSSALGESYSANRLGESYGKNRSKRLKLRN